MTRGLTEIARLGVKLGAKPLETLCEESGLSVGQILAALTELELAGKIIPLAGRRYQLK